MPTTDIAMEDPHAHKSSYSRANREHDDQVKRVKRAACGAGGDWSMAESGGILDEVVFSNPNFLQSMNARAFANYKCVCKSWAAWYYANIHTIAHARRQHQSSDCYFPLFGKVEKRGTEVAWSGIWHADERRPHFSQKQLSALPSLGYLQPIFGQQRAIVATTAGGLLLSLAPVDQCRFDLDEDGRRILPPLTLVVSNPLTKQVRVIEKKLPPLWDAHYSRVHICMLVDDEANTYSIILYSFYGFHQAQGSILVYDSTSMSWEHVWIEIPVMQPEFGTRTDDHIRRFYATACMGGRIYFADIRASSATEVQNDPLVDGVLRLLETDIRDGQRKAVGTATVREFPLRRSHEPRVNMIGLDGLLIDCYNTMSIMHNLELVECEGRLFAVIPARLDEVVHPWGPIRPDYEVESADTVTALGSKYLPVQFYILQLNGSVGDDGYLAHGVVRIEIPTARKGCKYLTRRRSLFQTMDHFNRIMCFCMFQMPKNWFKCMTKGSEIWITCQDYLVQYNIMSHEFKTHFLPQDRGVNRWDFVYRPSFHLMP